MTIFGVYATNDHALLEKKKEYFEQLSKQISKVGTSREIIVTGDMNGTTGTKDNTEVVGKYGKGTVNNNGKRLIEIFEQKTGVS